jgi:hypothetical protein
MKEPSRANTFTFEHAGMTGSFTVADPPEEAITGFSEGELFMRTGHYGDDQHPYAASYLSHEEAERLIRACADEYLAERNRESNVQN